MSSPIFDGTAYTSLVRGQLYKYIKKGLARVVRLRVTLGERISICRTMFMFVSWSVILCIAPIE